jgi:hypothetical protein
VLTAQAVKAATQLETDVTVDPEEVQRFGAGALADELDDAERQAKVRGTSHIVEKRGKGAERRLRSLHKEMGMLCCKNAMSGVV